MATTGSTAAGMPGESEKERLERNLQDLLEGLRVALPGVQVLFAFLLVVPFQQGWATVTGTQETIYYVTLLCTAIGAIFLIGPSARHRARFRQGDKGWVVITGNRLAAVGIAFVGAAIIGVILLITDVLFSSEAAIAAAAGIGALVAWVWFAAPLLRAIRGQHDTPEEREVS